MLGVGLRKLCPQDCFGYAFRERNLSENRPPEGATPARGGSKMAFGRPPGGSFVPAGPNLVAQAALKPCLGGPWGALGTLVTLFEPSFPGRSWAPLGGSFWDPPRADLDDLDVVCG